MKKILFYFLCLTCFLLRTTITVAETVAEEKKEMEFEKAPLIEEIEIGEETTMTPIATRTTYPIIATETETEIERRHLISSPKMVAELDIDRKKIIIGELFLNSRIKFEKKEDLLKVPFVSVRAIEVIAKQLPKDCKLIILSIRRRPLGGGKCSLHMSKDDDVGAIDLLIANNTMRKSYCIVRNLVFALQKEKIRAVELYGPQTNNNHFDHIHLGVTNGISKEEAVIKVKKDLSD
ncbi:MAG: hypothetical protein AAB530_02875 [Patescibacteria group bacterium]